MGIETQPQKPLTDCPECKGKGKLANGTACPPCRGRGKVPG